MFRPFGALEMRAVMSSPSSMSFAWVMTPMGWSRL